MYQLRLIQKQHGFTLLEVVVALTIGGMLLTSVVMALYQLQRVPGQQTARLVLLGEIDQALAYIRQDASRSQSFQSGTSPEYGTFRWLDFSTFPATRYKVTYFWEDGLLYRQLYADGVAETPVSLSRHVSQAGDITFTVTSAPHYAVPSSTQRMLVVTLKLTRDAGVSGLVEEEGSLQVTLRPEQTEVVDYLYLFLHNNPTPPTGDTVSQVDLPMNSTEPTTATLYNYDTDRDSNAGLRLLRGPVGGDVNLADSEKLQDWVTSPLSGPLVIDGRVALYLDAGALAFETGKAMTLRAWLRDLNPDTSSYTTIAATEGSFTTGAGWTSVSLDFPSVEYEVGQGHELVLRLQFDGISEEDGMVAYDTTNHLAFLSIPVQP